MDFYDSALYWIFPPQLKLKFIFLNILFLFRFQLTLITPPLVNCLQLDSTHIFCDVVEQ